MLGQIQVNSIKKANLFRRKKYLKTAKVRKDIEKTRQLAKFNQELKFYFIFIFFKSKSK